LARQVPRDREGSFEPQIVPKGERRLAGFDEKIISLDARGMTVAEIQGHLEELSGAEVSPGLISDVTDSVLAEVKAWQCRPVSAVYPILYLDALMVQVRDHGVIRTKAVYLALGVNLESDKELLGLWRSSTEGAKFWLPVLTKLKNRGLRQVCIAWVDGLTGFPEALEAAGPIVHCPSGPPVVALCHLQGPQTGGYRAEEGLRRPRCLWTPLPAPGTPSMPRSAGYGGGGGISGPPASPISPKFAR